jgi:hypothetical protein
MMPSVLFTLSKTNNNSIDKRLKFLLFGLIYIGFDKITIEIRNLFIQLEKSICKKKKPK